MKCPYCESEQYHHYGTRFECEECGCLFDENDIKWEDLRHAISHYLIDTSEENPIIFEPNEEAIIGENWPETFGLSTLDMYHLDRIFQVPGEGIIYFHIDGEHDETDPTGLKWHELDEEGFLDFHDMEEILEALEDREARLLEEKGVLAR